MAAAAGTQAALIAPRCMTAAGIRPGDAVLVRAGAGWSACVAWPAPATQAAAVAFDPCVDVSEAADVVSLGVRTSGAAELYLLPPPTRPGGWAAASSAELRVTDAGGVPLLGPLDLRQVGRLLRSLVLCCGAKVTTSGALPQHPAATITLVVVAIHSDDPSACKPPLFRVTSQTRLRVSSVLPELQPSRAAAGPAELRGEAARERDRPAAAPRVGGLSDEMDSLRELLMAQHAWPPRLPCPSGVLLHGPSGSGKTTLVRAVAAQTGAFFSYIHGPELHSPYPGEAEAALRRKFQDLHERVLAARCSQNYSVGLLFIDEIDALCPKRSDGALSSAAPEARLVATLLTLMDGIDSGDRGARVVTMAATNRPNAVDPALRRPGRFDREIYIGPPSPASRLAILQVLTDKLDLSAGARDELQQIADSCAGYVGADFGAMCREAALLAMGENGERAPVITASHLQAAVRSVRPASQRSMWSTEAPRTKWSDIGGLRDVKARLQRYIEWPFRYPEMFEALGIPALRGILLHGPPGCSKTTLVRAVATASEATFITASPAQVMSSYVGDAERTIRQIFGLARRAAPAVVFFDEIDALVSTRSVDGDRSGGVQQRLLATLLNEMDGVDRVAGVLVVAATNRIDIIDPALLRPGRFDQIVHVDTPTSLQDHAAILEVHTARMPLAPDVDLQDLAQRTVLAKSTGADIGALCREAAMHSLRELEGSSIGTGSNVVAVRHFEQALRRVIKAR